MTTAGARPVTARRRRPRWLRVFSTGLVLWILTIIVTDLTENANLLPTIILLGSFLVPGTFVLWAYERRPIATSAPFELVLSAFAVGGVLGVLGASLLESYLLRPSWWLFVGVGLIEEFVKIAALVWVTRRFADRTVGNGLLLGAAVGFGFAALESAGYALNALFTVRGLSLSALVETEILRGLLAPFGHGLWTAILGGVLFGAARGGRLRLTGGVIVAYLGVSLLHALWDSMHGIAVVLTYLITASERQIRLFEQGYVPRPTEEQVHLLTILDWGGLIVISLLGLAWLGALRRRAARNDTWLARPQA
jgi:RsiW-degrading membrane proteinase PrsW (M82 family)